MSQRKIGCRCYVDMLKAMSSVIFYGIFNSFLLPEKRKGFQTTFSDERLMDTAKSQRVETIKVRKLLESTSSNRQIY